MANDYPREWCTVIKTKQTKQITTGFEIGVELAFHTGGRICYGFLAANVRPHPEPDTVKISLAFTRGNTARYEDSCLLNDSFVYKGLPQEYVTQTIESMMAAIEGEGAYIQAEIRVDDSANCEVGSSPALFGVIGELLVKLINADSIEQVMDMETEAFTRKYLPAAPFALQS